VCCSVLQCVAVCCSVLPWFVPWPPAPSCRYFLHHCLCLYPYIRLCLDVTSLHMSISTSASLSWCYDVCEHAFICLCIFLSIYPSIHLYLQPHLCLCRFLHQLLFPMLWCTYARQFSVSLSTSLFLKWEWIFCANIFQGNISIGIFFSGNIFQGLFLNEAFENRHGTCIFIHTCICIYIYIYTYIYTYIYIYVYVTLLIHICAMNHSCVWLDSFLCVPCLIHMCEMTHSYVCHDSSICAMTHPYAPWLIHMCHDSSICAMTHQYVRWLIHMCATTCSCACRCSFLWHIPIHMRDIPHSYVWHDSFI